LDEIGFERLVESRGYVSTFERILRAFWCCGWRLTCQRATFDGLIQRQAKLSQKGRGRTVWGMDGGVGAWGQEVSGGRNCCGFCDPDRKRECKSAGLSDRAALFLPPAFPAEPSATRGNDFIGDKTDARHPAWERQVTSGPAIRGAQGRLPTITEMRDGPESRLWPTQRRLVDLHSS